jgi:signal peptidase
MSTAVLNGRAVPLAPALSLAPAAVRLVVKTLLGVVLLGLVTLVVGPRLYPFESFYVRSGSMSPTVPVGALVIATRAPAAQLGRGDVIVFQRPGRPGPMIVHRIYAVVQTPTGRAFMTKGDANQGPDDWVVAATGDGWRAQYSMARAGFMVGWLHAALSRRGWLGAFAVLVAVGALITIWQSEEP